MGAIHEFIAATTLGEPQVSLNLTMIPLIRKADPGIDYLLLDEALDAGLCEVEEISEGGSVPELSFLNRADKPVLLLHGEELVGAKQNRIINLTILVPASSKLLIPVSCVEQGRWSYRSRRFAAGKRKMYARLRARTMRDVSASMMQTGERRSDQGAVWDDVSMKASFCRSESPTEAVADAYEAASDRLADLRAGLAPVDNQVGAIMLAGGEVLGVDAYDRAETFSKLFGKLVDSYAMDAIELAEMPATGTTAQGLDAFLSELAQCPEQAFEAIGAGQDLRASDEHVSAAALKVEADLLHLSAFRSAELA